MIKTLPSISGSFVSRGLKTKGRITVVQINSDEWTPLPENALEGRNAISIQNDTNNDIKIQFDPDVAEYVGVTIGKSSERFYQITDEIPIYGRTQIGSANIIIEELA